MRTGIRRRFKKAMVGQVEPTLVTPESIDKDGSILCLGKMRRKTFPARGRGCAVALTSYGVTWLKVAKFSHLQYWFRACSARCGCFDIFMKVVK
jgi:hypothetical protein